jgi:hypothetical protein
MKFNSPIYDRIRVKPAQDRRRAEAPSCEWTGCTSPATHRAPKGRGREHQYWRFCLDHVREYNHSYNFFAGMSEEAVARYQKDAVTGHRPTWKMGVGKRAADMQAGYEGAQDPFVMFREFGGQWRPNFERKTPEGRSIRNAERKALTVLGLEMDATATDIKAKFKILVKRHHPDANGGDRACEDQLREIIQAYNYLKSVGYR